jgi:hypothetical protein
MDQIFNEISLSACHPNRHSARGAMERMVEVSKKLCDYGFSKTVRTTQDFRQRLLAPDYSINDWVRDKDVDLEKRRLFLTFATASPYIEKFYDQLEDDRELIEYRLCDELALGLGLAHLWDIPVVSLSGDVRFGDGDVFLERFITTADNESSENVKVKSIASGSYLERSGGEIRNSLLRKILSGKDIVSLAEELFPHLCFTTSAQKQIVDLKGSEQFFPEVVRHLSALDRCAQAYSGGAFEPDLDWSTESTATMKVKKYAAMRKFLCSDSVVRTFKLHSKILSANKRIHFYPEMKKRLVFIGYVGDHLPTVKYST